MIGEDLPQGSQEKTREELLNAAPEGTPDGARSASVTEPHNEIGEEALLKAGALQSAIFNSANFFSIATDAKGVIQIFNVGAERMLGYTAAEVTDQITPADISDPQEVTAPVTALSIELGTQITPGFEALVLKASRSIEDIYDLTYIRKDGSRFPAVVSITDLRDDENAIIGYLLIGTDNTARKKAEETLLKAGALQNAIFNSANFSQHFLAGRLLGRTGHQFGHERHHHGGSVHHHGHRRQPRRPCTRAHRSRNDGVQHGDPARSGGLDRRQNTYALRATLYDFPIHAIPERRLCGSRKRQNHPETFQ